jgi:hypothetical protein
VKKIIKEGKSENGQVLVLAALFMVVLMSFAALAIDIGMATVTKTKLQNDADAAALAAASNISAGKTTAEKTAINYAKANDSHLEDSKIHTEADYNLGTVKAVADTGSRTVEVVCTKKISYTFARVMGFKDTVISARAVAEKKGFNGGTMPFINFDTYEEGGEIELWDREGKGNKERLDTKTLYYQFDPEVGAIHGNGKMSSIKDEVGEICTDGATIYLLSLSNDVMVENSEIPVTTKNGKEESFEWPSGNVGEGSIINSQYLVLLKCTVKHYDNKTVKAVVEEVYEDLTPDGLKNIGSSAVLVE